MEQSAWQFSDDRGQLSTAGRTPSKVTAYIQAGATLWDHGIAPAAIFGSFHDGSTADPVKAGSLPLDGIGYLGAGSALDVDTLLTGGPDLVVAVSYGGGQVYGLDPDAAKHLEERVPVVVVDVGQARTLSEIRERFGALARSLGAAGDGEGQRLLDAARDRLRTVAGAPSGPRVLALSPAGPDQVHLARPTAWPDLRALTECGVRTVRPPEGGGANWATVSWSEAAELRPDIVLADVRANAAPLDTLRAVEGWQRIGAGARVMPWNPESPGTARAHARFFGAVADAVEAAAAR
ncbi:MULTISPECIES: ABC transporter substrate-binding protein [unclassified Streptomyces]|uniref:ABC transporter substrate-binding protein n=1 Tax=unclassified Streptomyces TaxID=2593676 RepID=UPI00225AA2F4|nr:MULTISPECIES: ABC transporter substrate-binding protein [unclassified Streptomyces]MCX4547546.1 ABC transporter substrate-binding protein [Streptomyces sp. NBC_01500]WSC19234.1 ABC transporter substrate-binding protein [Streptomyces sp. NBC_01766]WSV53257.1 ABC transporter substrate-binding protein [Streptomyces sp. NBC_01014]